MADNIEAVKEILDGLVEDGWHIGDGVDDCAGEDKDAEEKSIHRLARQIDALYQEGSPMYLDKDGQWKMKAQPDDLLLSDEEIHKLAEEVIQDNAIEAFEFAKKLAKAQHAKDQENCQKRIDSFIGDAEFMFNEGHFKKPLKLIEMWQALKAKEVSNG